MTPKIAFVHYAKAAGRYIDYYLQNSVFKRLSDNFEKLQFKTFNSWQFPFYLERDWTQSELEELANNRHPWQYPTPDQILAHYECWGHDYLSRQYVHNHHRSWSSHSLQAFRTNGWFTFMFIREPADLLCSLWTWAQKSRAQINASSPPIKPASLMEMSLDEFIQEILIKPGLNSFFALPEYVDDIDYVAEFTEENFQKFLLEQFDHIYNPESIDGAQHRFASGNLGYEVYRSQGLISETTHKLLNHNREVNRVREHLVY